MALNMKGNGRKIKQMDRANSTILMVLFMKVIYAMSINLAFKVIGLRIKLMAMEFIKILMEIATKATGETINNMAKDLKNVRKHYFSI